MNKKIASEIALAIIIFLAVIVGGYAYWQNKNSNQQRACTEEAKICPDGTAVGRTGPDCEFAPCSLNSDQDAANSDQEIVGGDRDEHGCIGSAGYSWYEKKQKCLRSWEEKCETGVSSWQTYTNKEYGFEFKYPAVTAIKEAADIVYVNGWKMVMLDNKTQVSDLKEWFKHNFEKSNNIDCEYLDSNIVIKNAKTILISGGTMMDKCDNGGYYTMSPDNSFIMEWDLGQDSGGNVDSILSTFRFTN